MNVNGTGNYSVYSIPLDVAGQQEISLQAEVIHYFKATVNGVRSLEPSMELSAGLALDDWMPFDVNNKLYGQSRIYRLRWDAQPGAVAFVFLSSDRAALDLETPPTKQIVTSALGTTLATGKAVVGAAAVEVRAATATRQKLRICNDTGPRVYLGSAGVTAATGYPLDAGETLEIAGATAALYGVSPDGAAVVRYMEEA